MIIYTVGHSNVPVEKMISLLKRHGVEMVFDVRSRPYSRFSPQFNRETLSATLGEAGVEYAYAGAQLGGRQDAGAPHQKCRREELAHNEAQKKQRYEEAVDRLVEAAAERRVAVMCAEEDPERCHRHFVIAQTLLDRGIEVQHIRGDGRLQRAEKEPQQLSLPGDWS